MQSIEVKPLTAAMVVRPSVLVRVSGLPVNAVAGLRSADAAAQLEEIVALRDRMDATRDTLSARLFLAVGSATNSGTRGALLALRRALYRAEQPSVAALKARERLRPEDSDAVERALRDMADYNAAVAALRNVYQAALVASRRHFQLALADPDFQKSLLLSTRTLFDNLARYRAADPTRLRSRDEQIERGLLRYFTRAAMKATPFARFCSIAAGEFVPSSDGAHEAEGLQFDAAPGAKRGFVRLNKYLYGILWSHLKSRPVVRRILTIDLNPTLSEEAGKIVFLVAVPGGEAFCRMRSGETLDFVVAFVKDTAGRSHFELSTVLASHPSVQSTFEEAEQYLDALLACGLLRFRSLVPEQLADWDLPLSVALSTSEDIHAQRVARLLVGVRALADAYSAADVSERSMLAERVRIMLRDAFSELGIHARLPRDLPIYEDAATPAQLLIPRHLGVEESLVKMVDWIAMTAPLAHPRSDNATMRHFFDTQYAGESAVPLLRFYEDFYREHFRGHLDKERRIERGAGDADLLGYDVENPFGLDYIRAVRQARSRLFEIVRARWAMNTEAGVLHLDANAVRTAIGPLMAAHPSSVCCSASVFCQIVVPPGDACNAPGQILCWFWKVLFTLSLHVAPHPAAAGIRRQCRVGGRHTTRRDLWRCSV